MPMASHLAGLAQPIMLSERAAHDSLIEVSEAATYLSSSTKNQCLPKSTTITDQSWARDWQPPGLSGSPSYSGNQGSTDDFGDGIFSVTQSLYSEAPIPACALEPTNVFDGYDSQNTIFSLPSSAIRQFDDQALSRTHAPVSGMHSHVTTFEVEVSENFNQPREFIPRPRNQARSLPASRLTSKNQLQVESVRKDRNYSRRPKCVRCRMQHYKCEPNPANPKGPCLRCSVLVNSIFRLPCFYYKIRDSVLFRTSIPGHLFYELHPMVGPKYGDFHIQKQWVSDERKILSITQDRGLVLRIEVREFVPPLQELATDDKGIFDHRAIFGSYGRPMYAIPWAVADPDIEFQKLEETINPFITTYISCILDDTDHLVWDVFEMAMRLKDFPKPDTFLQDVLRLWTSCRLVEGGWRCCGSDNLSADKAPNQLRATDWISPPPYVDYQFFSVVMHRLLGPLGKRVLKKLQFLVEENKPSNWFTVFLACFILLQSYELSLAFIARHAAKRKAPVRYLMMELVRGIHSGSKTILAHFHYCLKGQHPFQETFDWISPTSHRMAALDKEQVQFMQHYARLVRNKAGLLRTVSRTDLYHEPYWFISQLFESDWQPRDTYEHSPPS